MKNSLKAIVKTGIEKPAAAIGTDRLLRMAVVVAMCAVAGAAQAVAQNAKVLAEQHAGTIRTQIPAVFHVTPTTGSVAQLENRVVITGTGAIYSVRKSNVLIASYSTQATTADLTDTSVANDAGRAIPVSPKCHYVVAVSLPGITAPPMPDACRRDLAMGKARLIKSGQRVLLAGVDLFPDKDRVEFTLLEHHKSMGKESPRFLSQFSVQFPSGFLMTADAAKIAEAIRPFLAPSGDTVFQPFLPDAPPPVFTLEDNLYATLRPLSYQLEDETTGMGTTLHVIADRFMRAIPQDTPMIACTKTMRDGRAKEPNFFCKSQETTSVFMKPADELVVSAVKVESKKDKEVVRLEFIDKTQVDPNPRYDGSTGHYHGAVDIEFAKGSLNNESVKTVMDQVGAAFKIEGAAPAAPPTAIASASGSAGAPLALPVAMNTVPLPPVAAAPQTLEEQLKTLYKLTTMENAHVAAVGTTLAVTSDKLLLGTPYQKPAMCAASVVEGTPKPPAAACMAPLRSAILRHDAAFFMKGQKLDVVGITVDMGTETVAFSLIDEPAAGPNGAPKFHTMVKFVFPKGYLEGSDAGQVGGLVSSILEAPAGQV